MIEIQKARIHDIVHGSFLALNSLIPNPIKSQIRSMIRTTLNGQGGSGGGGIDSKKSEDAVKTDSTDKEIDKLNKEIGDLCNN